MYVDVSKVRSAKGKIYRRVLLRESFRENGRVRHRTLGNLSGCSEAEINAISLALKRKDELEAFMDQLAAPPPPAPPVRGQDQGRTAEGESHFTQGPGVGAIAVLHGVAKEIGIVDALGDGHEGRLALWQVFARALDQGSRLSAVRLARDHGAAAVLDLPSFDEDDLYTNLTWISQRQQAIEQRLFEHRGAGGEKPSLYLYDVTSTYLEGQHNALAAFGYNRDGKRGKKQIVIGLLCDDSGTPVALEAFPGNTADPKTVSSQIVKLQQRFHAPHITLVGDRGMLRGPQLSQLSLAGLHYITAISKPQIQTLLDGGTLQMELFDQELGEVIAPSTVELPAAADGSKPGADTRMERYILRRNPVRRDEIAASRAGKKQSVEHSVNALNIYLAEHPRARAATAERRVRQRIASLGLSGWLTVRIQDRALSLETDSAALTEESKLDGCYVLRTDLSAEQADKRVVHDRYKSLGEVEQVFRRGKTVELEMRPVHVRKETSTRGHLLVVMLAYLLMQELGKRWAALDVTVAEGLARLHTYCAVEVAGALQVMLRPRPDVQALIDAAGVTLPTALPRSASKVATKRKLPQRRKTRSK